MCNLRPTSRGSIRATAADWLAKPAIRPTYLATDEDRRTAAEAIRLSRRIAAAEPLARFGRGAAFETDGELVTAAGQIGATIVQPVGTGRMGTDPEAVVDARLRFKGLQRIRIADASIMPTITSGNTNAPTLMIAEKAAAILREDRKRTNSGD